MAKKEPEPFWWRRLKRTAAFKTAISEILRRWPCEGGFEESCDLEMDIGDAHDAWCRDLNALEEEEKKVMNEDVEPRSFETRNGHWVVIVRREVETEAQAERLAQQAQDRGWEAEIEFEYVP